MSDNARRLAVHIDPLLIKDLKMYALQEDMKVPELVEKMIRDFLLKNSAYSHK